MSLCSAASARFSVDGARRLDQGDDRPVVTDAAMVKPPPTRLDRLRRGSGTQLVEVTPAAADGAVAGRPMAPQRESVHLDRDGRDDQQRTSTMIPAPACHPCDNIWAHELVSLDEFVLERVAHEV